MRTRRRIDGEWTYFVIEDLPEAYQGWHGIADQLGLYLHFMPQSIDSYGAVVPTASAHLDDAYDNFQRSVDDLFRQTARVVPAPWEHALLEWVRRAKGHGLDWWLTGSAALAIRGAVVRPRDIDLTVADQDVHRVEDLLLDGLIQPVRPMTDWVHNTFARAFLGARIEWCGGVLDRADASFPSDQGPTAARRLETVTWQGYDIRVPPLDLHLRVSQERGLHERVSEIERLMAYGS